MKQGIHPDWHDECQVTCSCGNQFTIGSITTTLRVDMCDKCHPFFTGETKFVDRQNRIKRFESRQQHAQAQAAKAAQTPGAQQTQTTTAQQSYKDILRAQQ